MSSSGKSINYLIRPAKNVERKLIINTLNEFNKIKEVKKYRYIGFGSFYFVDFNLIHNVLNIKELISIENKDIKRCKFNKPLSCIRIIENESYVALNEDIIWNKKNNILWLDYDSALSQNILVDIKLCINKCNSLDYILFSFNSSIKGNSTEKRSYIESIFDNYVAHDLTDECYEVGNTHMVFHNIIKNCIEKAVSDKNAGILDENEQFYAKQSIFFKYADGAPMLTIGFSLVKYKDNELYKKLKLEKLPWYRDNKVPFNIFCANFTTKELLEINKMLPSKKGKKIIKKFSFLKESDIEKYINIYQYYPKYNEVVF